MRYLEAQDVKQVDFGWMSKFYIWTHGKSYHHIIIRLLLSVCTEFQN